MSVHDRKDQLIYSLTGLQATVWVGLFSVGFWAANPPAVFIVFWNAMAISTVSMLGLFLSAISCFYYAKHSENVDLHQSKEAKERARKLARIWKVPWNWHWYFFSIGILGDIVAAVSRFMGS